MKKQDIINELIEYYPELKSREEELQKKNKEYLKNLWESKRSITKTVLSTSSKFDNIEHIYHISDIHIRVLDRHDEYKQVFKTLVSELKTKPNGIIVITGDIFHTKERLLSETIVLFDYFVKSLLKLMPVVMIPGNHDSYLFSNRMDIITGIISVMNYADLYYLQTPGYYTLGNLDITFASPMTRELLDISKTKNDTHQNVCLYHGTIKNACSESGYVFVKEEELPVPDEFNKFELILLGDIHKHQFIQPNMAYSGSLIQQSYKEDLVMHGYIHWELKESWLGTFHKIPCSYGFLQYKLKDLPSEEVVREWPENLKVRLTIDTPEEKEELLSQFKQLLVGCGKTIHNLSLDYLNTETEEKQTVEDQTTDKETRLIQAFVKPELYDSVKEMHETYLSEIDETTFNHNNFTIHTLEFMNTFIYGENNINTIDFSDKNGSIGILANNASGKSSILNILIYALYGTVFKTKNYLTRNIIHKGKNSFYIRLILSDKKGDTYEIIREGKNRTRNSKKGMEEILLLRKHEGSKIIDLNDSNKLKTNDLIKQTLDLPSKEDFILDHVMSYQHNRSIIGMINSEIEEMLSHVFNTDKYRKIKDTVKKRLKEINSELQHSKGQLLSLEKHFKYTQHNIEEVEKNRGLLKGEIELTEDNISKTEKNIIKMESEVEKMKEDINKQSSYNVKDLKTKRDKLLYRLPKIDEKRLTSLLEVPSLEETPKALVNAKMDSIEDIIDSLPASKKPKALEETKAVSKELQKIKNNIEVLEDFTEAEVKKYTRIVESKEHETQQKEIESLVSALETNAFNPDTIKRAVSILRGVLTGKDKLTIYKNAEHNLGIYTKKMELKSKLDKTEKLYRHCLERDLEFLNEYLTYVEMKEYIEELETQLQDYEKNQQLRESFETLKNTLFSYEKHKRSLSQKLSLLKEKDTEYIKTIYGYNENKDMIEKLLEEKTMLASSINSMEKEAEILLEYKKLLDDQNLPKGMMKEGIKILEHEANKIIYPLCGLTVSLNTEEEKYELLIFKSNMCLAPEQCSGFERFCIDLGIKTSIKKLRKRGGLSLLFIDEVLDIISADNLDKIDDLLVKLQDYYKHVVLISHNEQLKDKVRHRVDINCDGISSRLA
jgi:DNA repair exonuclease SbcCD ATPase subunit/DNA repair exonuclease SbcCD nuclease subunit